MIWQSFKKAIMVERLCATLSALRKEGHLMTGLPIHLVTGRDFNWDKSDC